MRLVNWPNPDEILATVGLTEFFIAPHLDGFEHQYNAHFTPDEASEEQYHTLIRWQTSRRREANHIFQLSILDGLEHKYPNGCHAKNPNCFDAAETFWSFFESGPNW